MWETNTEFILSVISYGVGLGNLWRFPYLCAKHGGISFLVPYWTCLIFCGLPLCILENTIGQFSGKSPVMLFKNFPIFKGVGWAMMAVDFGGNFYYVVVVAYAVLFLYDSIPKSLPYTLPFAKESEFCQSLTSNSTSCQEQYFKHKILKHSNLTGTLAGYYDGLLEFNFPLVLAFLVIWYLVFLSLKNKTSSLGKISYVTALTPYFCLFVLLIVTAFQPGAKFGISKYLKFDFSKVFTKECWREAAQQVFYSQGCAWGVLITLASLNKFNTKIVKLGTFISILNGFTSFLNCFVVYGSIGVLAYDMNSENPGEHFDKIAENSGQGLIFVAYPTMLSKMGDFSWFMSLVFFMMVLALGVGSINSMTVVVVECVNELVRDFRRKRKTDARNHWSDVTILILIVMVHIVVTLPMLTRSGSQWLNLLNNYCGFIGMPLIALLEFVLIGYVFGVEKYLKEIRFMVEGKVILENLWKLSWCFTGPIVSLILLYFSIYEYEYKNFDPFVMEESSVLAHVVGWLTAVVPISAIFGFGLLRWIKEKNNSFIIRNEFFERKHVEMKKENSALLE